MAHISLLSNVKLTGLNPLNINKHELVRHSTARSYLGTINQHDHVLHSNAWSSFSFRTTNQHDHVLRSNAWSCFSFRPINQHQHEHVLRSDAWSCFSFRTINQHQHEHVLRSNAWSYFLFRHEAGWSRLCLWAGYFTQSCPVQIMYGLVHCSFASSLCTRPDMVSSLISKSNPMA